MPKYPGDKSCPWCFAPEELFRVNHQGFLGCPVCGGQIPEDAEWYQEGHKMISVQQAKKHGYVAQANEMLENEM